MTFWNHGERNPQKFFLHLTVLEFLDIMQIPQLHELHVVHLDTYVQVLNLKLIILSSE